ncbi:MAG: extracellular solute-binding protein [Candidatus Dojkabacteria bacterium]
MPDYYEQPAYLKEIETTTVAQPPETYSPVVPSTTTTTTTTEVTPRRKIPVYVFIIIGVILFLLLLFLLIPRGTTPTTPTTTGKVTLQWWGVFLDPSVVKPLIDEYQKNNANVTIQYANKFPEGQYDTAAKQYQTELNRVLKTNDPVVIPDIFMVQNTWAGDYESVVKSSTSYDYDTFKSIFYPAVVTDFTSASSKSVYGVPLWFDDLAIIYNKDLLKEVAASTPQTDWVNFQSLAKSLTKRQNGQIVQAGFGAGVGSNVTYATELFNLLMAQNGVQIVNDQGQPAFGADTDSLTALQSFKDYATGGTGTWSADLKVDAASFLERKLAMMVTTSYKYREIKTFNETYQLGIDIGVSPIPQLQGQTQPVINWADYWGAMVPSVRPNAAAAWTFLKWMTDPDQIRKLTKNEADFNKQFGFMSPRIDMAQDATTDVNLKVFNDSLPFAMSWKMIKGADVKEQFIKLFDQSGTSLPSIVSTQTAIQSLMSNKGKF